MESDDPAPLEISSEDDSLLQSDVVLSLPKNSEGFLFYCSPLHIARSTECKMEKASSSLLIGNVDKENSSTNKLEVPDLCVEPQQTTRKKKGKGFNLRKSLAWDRAFFTEEGVLNQTELSWITGDVQSVLDNTSGSKRSGCPQPVSSSSMKRVARVGATKTLTSKSATPAERHSKHNQIPQPPKSQNSRSRGGSLSGFAAHNSDTLGSVKKSLPAKCSVQQARRNLTRTVVQNRPVSRKDIGMQFNLVPGISVSSQLSNNCIVGSSTVATLPPSITRNSSGIMQNAKLQMARPSGLRKPSPSLGYFNQHKTSSSHDKWSRVLQPSNHPSSSTCNTLRVGTLNMTGIMELPIAKGTTREGATINGNTWIPNLKNPKTGDSCDSSMEVKDHVEDHIMLNESEGSETYGSHFSKNTILLGELQTFEDKCTSKMNAVPADPFSISKFAHIEDIENEVQEVYGTSPEPLLGNIPQQALSKNSSIASNEIASNELSFVDGLCKHSAGHPEFQKPSNSSEVDGNVAVERFDDQLREENISEQCDGSSDKSGYQYVSAHLEHVLKDGHTDIGGKNVFPHLNAVNVSSIVQCSSSNHNMESSHYLVNGAATSELEAISQSNYQTSEAAASELDLISQSNYQTSAAVVNSSRAVFLGNKESVSLDKSEEMFTDGCIVQEIVNVSKCNSLPGKTKDSFSHSSCSSKCDCHCKLSDSNDKIEKENATTSPDFQKSSNERKPGVLTIKPPANAVPFSDEWLAVLEAAGEDILTMKGGAVQNSPPEKSVPEPSPWSPVRRKNNQGIGPYDCTKYSGTNISNSDPH